MQLFQLAVPWDSLGDNPFPWVDSRDGLFGPEGLRKPQALLEFWNTPTLQLSADAPTVDAYCCPGGYFVFSTEARRLLTPVFQSCAEWLPIDLDGLGIYSLVHPLRVIPFGPRARVRCNEVSGNISSVEHFDFDRSSLNDTPIFFPAHPEGSAAARAGFCVGHVITCAQAARQWEDSGMSGVRFRPLPVPGSE